MATTTWTCVAIFGVCLANAAAEADGLISDALYDKSRALIIGIDQYPQGRSVPGAVEEAKQVAQVLRQLGFEEILELYNKDATARRLHAALTDLFGKKVDRSGRVVVFFAGHTASTRDGKGRDIGYLVPADAQPGSGSKFVTVETIREFSKRSPSKHALLIVNGPLRAPEGISVKPSLPQAGTDARAVQVIAAGGRDERAVKPPVKASFVQAVLTGLSGAADLDQDGWLTASELGAYVKQQIDAISIRIEGDGDTVLLQKRKAVAPLDSHPPDTQQPRHDREAARIEYDQALAHLQGGKYAEEALASLNRAIEDDPSFAEAYILKSYLRLEVLPQLDEALDAGRQAVKHAPDNADAFYSLGLAHERMGHAKEAEQALVQATKLNPENLDAFFALGTVYEDQLSDQAKSVEAFRRYLELGGADGRARAAVSQAQQGVSSLPNTSQ